MIKTRPAAVFASRLNASPKDHPALSDEALLAIEQDVVVRVRKQGRRDTYGALVNAKCLTDLGRAVLANEDRQRHEARLQAGLDGALRKKFKNRKVREIAKQRLRDLRSNATSKAKDHGL